jgi:hypothetical protein
VTQWKDDQVKNVVTDPRYTGMGPFEQIVPEDVWIANNVKVIDEVGAEAYLKNMLAKLREMFATAEQLAFSEVNGSN